MQIYSYRDGEKLLNRFLQREGARVCRFDGGMVDSYLVTAEKCKTAAIKEKYLNEWSSGVTIRMYNKCPAKYAKVFDLYEEGNEEEAERVFYS